MNSLTILTIFLAILFSLLLVFYQYYYKAKKNSATLFLSALRFVSVFCTILLLINLQISSTRLEIVKPKLWLAIDNSSSIKFGKQDSLVQKLAERIQEDKEINNKFDLVVLTFGEQLQINKNLNFLENHTNIYEALKGINELEKQKNDPIILISDGNQTFGNDYRYFDSKQQIFPVIVGDTTEISDLQISQINVNSYTYLNNNFPVEVFVNYLGNSPVQTKITVLENGKTHFTQNIKLSKKKSSKHIQFSLPAENVGKHIYSIKLQSFDKEINTKNNTKKFNIEVIDEQTSIALVYDALHPDIGMIKRSIETNKQRKVTLINLNEPIDVLINHDVYILYQPNRKFQPIIEKVNSSGSSVFYITGKKTEWNFLNQIQTDFRKKKVLSYENQYPVYNSKFNSFFTEDIGYKDFPPLEDLFGETEMLSANQVLLFQMINGIETKNPLLVTFSDQVKRKAVLFGENSWKWRMASFETNQSFEEFDHFFNSIIQFLVITNKKNTIELNYKSFYYNNETIVIRAKSYDDNLNFDNKALLEFKMKKEGKAIPFYLTNNSYELKLNDLKSGEYHFTVVNKLNNKKQNGSFFVAEYAVEQELLGANTDALENIANNSGGQIYYPSQVNELNQKLISDTNYIAIQKENKKLISLIDWKWLLDIIILSLSVEWFIRKYRGLL